MDRVQKAINISFLVGFVMLLGKFLAAYLTASTAILSDALESIVHILVTGISLLAIYYSNKPADKEHPYGHKKASLLSVFMEGVIILFVAFYIFYIAIKSFFTGDYITNLTYGGSIVVVLILINSALAVYLIKTGKEENNFSLIANGKHIVSDIYTSIGALLGAVLARVTGLIWLDPLVALFVAVKIILMGRELIYMAIGNALDFADNEVTQVVKDVLNKAVREGLILNYHQLRHRVVNDTIWLEVHIVMPGNLLLVDAHQCVTELEDKIKKSLSQYNIVITSHLEPEECIQLHPKGHELREDPLID